MPYTVGMNLPYDYMPLVMEAINLISQGYTETAACDDLRLSLITFKNHIKNNETLQELYDEALQRGYDAMAQALLRPDNHHLYGHSDAKMAKVQSDNIKWFLERIAAKKYGQKVEVNHTITADKAITQALLAARDRTRSALPDMEIIDVTPVAQDDEMMREMGLVPLHA